MTYGDMTMLTVALALTGASIKLAGYGKYFMGIRRGEMRPNTATWTLWVFLSSLNSASYLLMSHDLLKSSVALAGTSGCLITYVYALHKGSLKPLNGWDTAALAIGVLAGLAWMVSRSASYANIILQGGFFLSMIPTYRGLLADHDAEKPAPWLLMALAYAINMGVVVTRWDGNWVGYLYPALNMFTHGGVGLLAMTLSRPPKHAHAVDTAAHPQP